MPSLADAIIYDEVTQVAKLLEAADVDVNEIDEYGFTPLVEAAIVKKTDVARLLIQKKADVNLMDTTGHAPLHWATDSHQLDMVKLLLEAGANPNQASRAQQSPLVLPLLRQEADMVDLLVEQGADKHFAEDFIQAKVLAHQFELRTKIDILNAQGNFVEMNLEGFLLEATVGIVADSVQYYTNHFSGRKHRPIFSGFRELFQAFSRSMEVMRYQHFTMNSDLFHAQVHKLLEPSLLVLPVAYRGHAVGFLQFGDYLAKCDRGAYGKENGTLLIFKSLKPQLMNADFWQRLLFQRTSEEFVHQSLNKILGLVHLTTIPLPAQLTGNCTWANIEGLIPAYVFFMLNHSGVSLQNAESQAQAFFEDWSRWNKDRALSRALQSFHHANDARKASIATLLAAVLFQCCRYENSEDYARAQKIVDIFKDPKYQYIIDSYLQVHFKKYKTLGGKNLHELLDILGLSTAHHTA